MGRKLIQDKEERRKEAVETNAFTLKIKEWMTGEEARRNAVEEVLEQLLARDTQYRKELSCHLDNRMEIAKRRRSFHRQQYREVKEEMSFKDEHCRNQITQKMTKAEDLRRKREEALERSRKLAAKGAEL